MVVSSLAGLHDFHGHQLVPGDQMKHAPPTHLAAEPSPIPRTALRVDEAARSLGLSRTGLYRLIREGKIRVVKVGSRTVIPLTALDEILKRNAEAE
jgi:excisionase family DNA binding protein